MRLQRCFHALLSCVVVTNVVVGVAVSDVVVGVVITYVVGGVVITGVIFRVVVVIGGFVNFVFVVGVIDGRGSGGGDGN